MKILTAVIFAIFVASTAWPPHARADETDAGPSADEAGVITGTSPDAESNPNCPLMQAQRNLNADGYACTECKKDLKNQDNNPSDDTKKNSAQPDESPAGSTP